MNEYQTALLEAHTVKKLLETEADLTTRVVFWEYIVKRMDEHNFTDYQVNHPDLEGIV